ncbi:anti-sigma factor family protein [Streptomyces sp. NPDC048521]|uniref:anti-sigma factor family protein n=1 Tax=Streptomyces sp. NPDC048521 TaxID=3365566 RepID=UPI00372333C6
MTSTTDTAGHPDVAEISDLTEGLLPPDRSAHIRRHLEACELCADVHASLEEIQELLGSVPEVERMPADVAGRIDAALAAEALLSASAPRMDAHIIGSAEATREDDEGRVSRETTTPSDRPAGRPSAATGPGRKGRDRGRRRRHVVLGAVLTAAVLGAGSLVLQSFGDHSGDTTAHGQQTPSAGPFSGNSVQSQVKDLLATKKDTRRGTDSQSPRGDVGSGQNTPGTTESPKTLIQTDAAVPDCVRHALRRSDSVLGAKTGTYDGKAAYLVVVPDTKDSTRVTAYVIDAACVHQQPASTGTVLLKRSYSRP